jgi:hypothetical protein
VDVMGEPVQQGPRQPLGSEGLGPFVERKVAGHQRGAAFVSSAEDLKQQLGPGLGKWHEAQFVDDQQLETGEQLLETHQAPFVLGLDQFMRQRCRGGEPDAEAFLTSGQAQSQGDVGFPRARRARNIMPMVPR